LTTKPTDAPTTTNSVSTQTFKVIFRKSDLAFTENLIPGPVLLPHGGYLHVANKVNHFIDLANREEYLTLKEEVQALLTPLFNALEKLHGPRHSSKKIEKQRYNLKSFICPVLTVTKFLISNSHWPQYLLQPSRDLLNSLLARLLTLNDDGHY
jgi:hypothetical protein